ncbi:MAG: hypothetical protein WCE81_01610 [Halobacteriota archaeon]
MRMKNAILSVSIIAILTICMFNSVAAAPMSKQTPDVHSNSAVDVRGQQQTYLLFGGTTNTGTTVGVGQSVQTSGILSHDTPPTSLNDYSHGLPDATVNTQLNYGGTWTTVATETTWAANYGGGAGMTGVFFVTLTPGAAGVYTYRATYDGNSQYAPTISSNTVTLTVTNVAVS